MNRRKEFGLMSFFIITMTYPDGDAWNQHLVAHVHYLQKLVEDGILLFGHERWVIAVGISPDNGGPCLVSKQAYIMALVCR